MIKLKESTNGSCLIKESKGKYYIEGLIFECNKPNANNRVYPKSLVESEFNRIQKDMSRGKKTQVILDHTDSNGLKLSSYLGTLQNFQWNGNSIFGRASLGDTLATKTLLEISKNNLPFGFSPESQGELEDAGAYKVVKNLKIINIAVVSNPSNQSQANILAEAIQKLRQDISLDECLEANLKRLLQEEQPLSNKIVDPFIRLIVGKDRLNESALPFIKPKVDYDSIVEQVRQDWIRR